MTINQNLSHKINNNKTTQQRKIQVVEEIEGIIKVYSDGHVERPEIVPSVGCSLAPDLAVTCRDSVVDRYTNVSARVYVPTAASANNKLPLLLYFHGGGFCVGAASWSCYHHFLARLAAAASCAVVSVDYRLAPEHPLPAAYDDGVKAALWAAGGAAGEWWAGRCDFSRIFIGGDSAGANIAYNVGLRVNYSLGFRIRGLVLIQPFFGGEARTQSERGAAAGALTLAAADAYWRMALPRGAGRDHPWCNAAAAGSELRRMGSAVMVCVAEADILRDRNWEFCGGLAREGVRVEQVVSRGVGHAFQVLDKSHLAETRLQEMLCRVKNFVWR